MDEEITKGFNYACMEDNKRIPAEYRALVNGLLLQVYISCFFAGTYKKTVPMMIDFGIIGTNRIRYA